MYWKNSSIYRAVFILVCLLMVLCAEAQLNYSTGWGKRNKNLQTDGRDSTCTPPLERILNLYNLIQLEAQFLRDCHKSSQGSL